MGIHEDQTNVLRDVMEHGKVITSLEEIYCISNIKKFVKLFHESFVLNARGERGFFGRHVKSKPATFGEFWSKVETQGTVSEQKLAEITHMAAEQAHCVMKYGDDDGSHGMTRLEFIDF